MSRDWTLYLEDLVEACRLIVHRYFALDPAVVWSIVQTRIPALSSAARRVLSEFDGGGLPGSAG
jgi:uncharacterized protein with HEPN domain